MKNSFVLLLCILCSKMTFSQNKLRGLADTVGFAHTAKQMDEVMKRIEEEHKDLLKKGQVTAAVKGQSSWRVAVSPHDDYSYAGYLYPLVLKNVKTKKVFLIGVAHKAKAYQLENKIIFDEFSHWSGPYGPVKVSELRNQIISSLPMDVYQVHQEMQTVEHSVEAIVPFLQYYNRDVEIIPILVPAMPFERMKVVSQSLARSIKKVCDENRLNWGSDYSIVISADAVHYGDESWGGKNFAFYGADSTGYKKAVAHEQRIISETLAGAIDEKKVEKFINFTVKEEDYKEYKWTWCGRYSVPFGLLIAYYLATELNEKVPTGIPLGYATSLDHSHIKVDDLGLGVTAPATIRHWVGYPSVGYR